MLFICYVFRNRYVSKFFEFFLKETIRLNSNKIQKQYKLLKMLDLYDIHNKIQGCSCIFDKHYDSFFKCLNEIVL